MYCPECGKLNPEDSDYCQKCGVKIDDNTIVPDGGLANDVVPAINLTPNVPPYPYIISIPKLIVLSVATFSFYDIYWFYKQWKSFNVERDLKVTPWVRAFFATLTSYSLFKEVSKALKSVDKTRGLEAGWLAVAYLFLFILYKLPEPYWWLSMLSVLPLIPVQSAINTYWKNKYGERVIPSGFGTWNWVWAITGGIILLLVLYDSFGTATSSNTIPYSSQSNPTINTVNNGVPMNRPLSNYNQEDVVSSVVNIFCPSTVKGEDVTGGSGTIITEDGMILTNSHIIPQSKGKINVDSDGCIVSLPDSKTGQPKEIYWAEPVVIPDISDKYDLAFMLIYAAVYSTDDNKYMGEYPQKFLAFDDTTRCTNQDIKLGEPVRVFGYPAIGGGYSLTITDGLVSSFPGDGLIVTSAKISYGNSGGLAIDKNGCMVGVPSMINSDSSESLGVIISASLVRQFSTEVTTYLKKR